MTKNIVHLDQTDTTYVHDDNNNQKIFPDFLSNNLDDNNNDNVNTSLTPDTVMLMKAYEKAYPDISPKVNDAFLDIYRVHERKKDNLKAFMIEHMRQKKILEDNDNKNKIIEKKR